MSDVSEVAPPPPPIEARGFKYLLDVVPLLERLHGCGAARDAAGNRTLFYDQYVSLLLVALFSPSIDSMRAVCRASDLKKVQRKLGGQTRQPRLVLREQPP